MTPDDVPRYTSLMYPVVQALDALGGSASGREITYQVIEAEGFTDDRRYVRHGSVFTDNAASHLGL